MAEVATLSSQQATTSQIMAPASTSKVTVTSIQQAQQLIASREQALVKLDAEWSAANDSAETWDRLSQTASSETLRASAKQQRDRYKASADIVMREIIRVEDELSFFESELERLRVATGLPGTPMTAADIAKQAAAKAAAAAQAQAQALKNAAVAAAQGRTPPATTTTTLPFGMTTQQAVTLIGGGALLVLAASHLFPPKA